MTKPNSKFIYLVADTEAQMRFNDEQENFNVNVVLKNQRAKLERQIKNGLGVYDDLKSC